MLIITNHFTYKNRMNGVKRNVQDKNLFGIYKR